MGTIADKLQALNNTKSEIKAAVNNTGQTAGNVFSTYSGLINNYVNSVNTGKSLVAQAITNKGVETADDATFQQMADNINAIQSGIEVETVKLTWKGFSRICCVRLNEDNELEVTDIEQPITYDEKVFDVLKNSLVYVENPAGINYDNNIERLVSDYNCLCFKILNDATVGGW